MATLRPFTKGPWFERKMSRTCLDLLWISGQIGLVCDCDLIFDSLLRSWIEIRWILFWSLHNFWYFLAAPNWKPWCSLYGPGLLTTDNYRPCKWETFAPKFGRQTILKTGDALALRQIAAIFELDFFLWHNYHNERLKRPFSNPLHHYFHVSFILNFDLRSSSW